jgi:hypothetical protein
MDSQVQVYSAGGPCVALLVVSILQLILLGFCGLLTRILVDTSAAEFQSNSLGQDSWIARLALEFTILTVMVSMAVGCALGIYTGVLGMKGKSHHEGIRPAVRFLAAFLKHVTVEST